MQIIDEQTRRTIRDNIFTFMCDRVSRIVGKACEQHLYAGVDRHASMLEERGLSHAAIALRNRLPRRTEELYNTDTREAIRIHQLLKTGKLELVRPEKTND